MTSAADEFEYYSTDTQSASSTLSTLENRCSWEKQRINLEDFPEWKVPNDTNQSKEYTSIRQELYNSERSYLQYLCTLQKLYINPLAKLRKMVSKSDLRSLFGDLTSIYTLNKELLSSLRNHPTVFESFTTLVPFLKLYTGYAGNYQNSQRTYERLMLKSDFRLFIEQQESDPGSSNIKFMALMIMPVQRIPRYILLLKRLREETNSPQERSDLKRVLAQMGELTDLLDSCINEFENGEKLWLIQESLGIKEGIVGPGRRLLKEGALFKRNLCGEATYHERYFWLFNDILVYGKRRIGMGPRYECSCIFQLHHVQLAYNVYEGSMQVKCKSHSLSLTSDSYDTLKEWNDCMEEAIDRVRLLRRTLRKESSLQPVREFKSQIRKKFTKRFVNTNYLYRVNTRNAKKEVLKKKMAEVCSPSDVNVMDSPYHVGTSEPQRCNTLPESSLESLQHTPVARKRKADEQTSEFDRELEEAVRRRKIATEGSPVSRYSTPNSNGVRVPLRSANSRRTPIMETDEVTMRDDRPVLTKPQIRKFSYMESDGTCTGANADSEAPSADTSMEDPNIENTESLCSSSKVPWWVTEAQPAEFRKTPRRSGVLGNACTIL